MLKHIQRYSAVNESFRQHGVILIKGKPKKGGERFLYAGHVNAELELKAGAKMMVLSDTFYRVVRGESGKLKGEKINWRSEDSLKAALNLKSPGKISLVKNNNKTPYHWKTLKHTNITDALSAVDQDLRDPDYLFESANGSIENRLAVDILRTAFAGEKTGVIIIGFNAPYGAMNEHAWDRMDGEGSGSTSYEWEVTLDCLYIGEDETYEYLKEKDELRFETALTLYSEYSFTRIDEDELEMDDVLTTIENMYVLDEEVNLSEINESVNELIDKYISESVDEDIYDSIANKNANFFKS